MNTVFNRAALTPRYGRYRSQWPVFHLQTSSAPAVVHPLTSLPTAMALRELHQSTFFLWTVLNPSHLRTSNKQQLIGNKSKNISYQSDGGAGACGPCSSPIAPNGGPNSIGIEKNPCTCQPKEPTLAYREAGDIDQSYPYRLRHYGVQKYALMKVGDKKLSSGWQTHLYRSLFCKKTCGEGLPPDQLFFLKPNKGPAVRLSWLDM